MEQTEWSTVHRIFSQAVDLAPGDRAEYVRAATADLPQVQTAVLALLDADSDAGDYLEQPLVKSGDLERLHQGLSGALQPGTVLAGRFEILREVGAGGMGRVYEALDTEFHARVAIKTIREDLLDSPNALRRFRHEAQLARRLSHPNICRIHDLERTPLPGAGSGEGTELCFITMEFLDGVSLADELRRRVALPLDEVTAIARQTAAALDTAHRAGVTHGDLKPANILLCREGGELRVVVTDFGLARAHTAEAVAGSSTSASATLAAAPMGTLAYMAPEQIAGEPASPASDRYAYGLVLYELLTGRRAFADENPLKGIASRLTAQPPSPRAERPGLPEGWCLAVIQCLRTTPAERPATAAAALALAVKPAAARRQRLRNALRTSARSRKPLLWAAAVVVAVSLFFVFFRFQKTEAPGPVKAGARIYMPPVRNLTGNPKLNGVTALLEAALAQSPQFTLLPEADAAQTLQRMMRPPDTAIDETTAREIALRTQSQRVVFITLRNMDGKLQLRVDLQQPDTHTPARPRRSEEHAWSCCATPSGQAAQTAQQDIPGDLLHIVRDTADWVRHNTGEPAETLRDLNEPVEDITTMSWQALNEFSESERLVRAGRQADAVTVLQQAVQHDPGFALAYARMGDLQFYLKRAKEGIASYQRALATGSDRRLSRRERDRLRGLYAIDTWDYPMAEQVFRDAVIYYEHDYLSRFYLGGALFHIGRVPEAEEAFRSASSLQPERSSPHFTLASIAFMQGDPSTAHQHIDALRTNGSATEALWLQAEDAWLQEDGDRAFLLLQQAQAATRSPMRALSNAQLIRLAAARHDLATARRLATEGISAAEHDGNVEVAANRRMDLAAFSCATKDVSGCMQAVRASLRDDSSPRNVRNAGDILRNALSHATRSQRQLIARELRTIDRTLPNEIYGTASEVIHLELGGDIALAENHPAAAVDAFQNAATREARHDAEFRKFRTFRLATLLPYMSDSAREIFRQQVGALKFSAKSIRARLWYECDYFPPEMMGAFP